MQAQRAVIAAIEFQPGVALVQQIVDQLSVAISQGGLPHGAKLPPIRELSELMNVGKSTVVDALDRCAPRGWWFHARARGTTSNGPSTSHQGCRQARTCNPRTYSVEVRRAILLNNGALRPGCGFLPGSWLPAEELLKSRARHPSCDCATHGRIR